MITPGLWRRALRGALQWRLLLLWVVVMAVPALGVLAPLQRLLSGALDHAPRAPQLVAALDAIAFVDLARVLGGPEAKAALGAGVSVAVLLALVVSPLLAASAVAVAREPDRLRWQPLLRGAAEGYGRMLRLLAVAVIPLGLAGALGGAAMRAAGKRALDVYTQASARLGARAAVALLAVLVFVAHVTLDLARGVFAAQPHRRSALFAWGHGLTVLVRRPLRVLSLAALASGVALGLAALLLLVRLQIAQGSAAAVLLAFALAQVAVAAIGWGRAARVIGFAELVRADAAVRSRLSAPRPPAAADATVPAQAQPAPVLPPAPPAAVEREPGPGAQ